MTPLEWGQLTLSHASSMLCDVSKEQWSWVAEDHPARWTSQMARIVGKEPAGVFDTRYGKCHEGEVVPGSWWRVEDDGRVIAYGWMDINWGDAEILLAIDLEARQQGVGTWVVENLKREALRRGLNYLTNVVRPTHPDRERVAKWLEKRGFSSAEDGRHFRAVSR